MEDVFQDVGERDDTLEPVIIVDYDESVDTALTNRIEDSSQPIVLRAGVDTRAVIGSLVQSLSNSTAQLLVHSAFDTRYYVHGLKDVEHPVVIVDYGNAADVTFHELVDDVKDRVAHPGRQNVFVGTQVELTNCTLEQNRVVLVVHGDELEDSILRDDGHNPRPTCLSILVDKGDTSRSGFEHSGARIVERR